MSALKEKEKRADGGRLIKPGKYPIDSSAAGGLGRLEKAKGY